jgi:hypothetical protein
MVGTDMGNHAADTFGVKLEDLGGISPDESIKGVVRVIDEATKATHGGKFWSYDGSQMTY